ncbi:MAG: signal transduction histidine kinase [Candidatus Omnitrophota bacterium]|jgi:signal transduction histidine kinase
MRIATHIKLFLSFILVLIAANAYIGTHQINLISQNLKKVVNENFVLVKHINQIRQTQYEKAIIFERGLRISEEFNFENVTNVRRRYIFSHAKILNKGYSKLTQDIAKTLKETHGIISNELKNKENVHRNDYEKTLQILTEVEQRQNNYDIFAKKVLDAVSQASFELSISDIETIEKNEAQLNKALKDLHVNVDYLSQKIIVRTEMEKEVAVDTFKISMMSSIIISFLVAIYLIGRLSKPLANLSDAARRIGAGDFHVKLKAVRNDEVAEVSKAFNTMANQLFEKDEKLRKQSELLEENLRITEEQKKDLEKVNQELDRFVYTVSHDIGAPLMGIAWYGNYLQNNFKGKFDKKGSDCVDGIVKGATRLNVLIKDLLALTRISRIKNPYEKVDMRTLIQSILDRIEFQIAQDDVKIDWPEHLPEIICDRIKLGEVFYNLISNGIKFSAKTTTPEITIAYECDDNKHQFSIKDNGIGIDEKFHKDIFSIFRRLHTHAEYEGTGAGLSIVQTIINDHKGDIWVESKPDEGAKFVFTIPNNLEVL